MKAFKRSSYNLDFESKLWLGKGISIFCFAQIKCRIFFAQKLIEGNMGSLASVRHGTAPRARPSGRRSSGPGAAVPSEPASGWDRPVWWTGIPVLKTFFFFLYTETPVSSWKKISAPIFRFHRFFQCHWIFRCNRFHWSHVLQTILVLLDSPILTLLPVFDAVATRDVEKMTWCVL